MTNKIAIVSSGGGMSCSYSSGVMKALVEKYKFTNPDIVVAASGSSGVLTYYVSKQYKPMVNIWCDYLTNKKFINPLRFWKIINVDYLIDAVLGNKEKLDESVVKYSKTKLFIPAINIKTGEVKYFSNKDNILEALRASKAMPLAYNKYVKIKNEKYCDSSISSSIEMNILKAIELGAKKVIAIDTRNLNKTLLYNLWLYSRNSLFKKNYNTSKSKINEFNLPKGTECLFLKYNKNYGTFRNTKEFLKVSIDKGYKDAVNSKELKNIISSS